jgi:uncharacterized protein
VAGWPVRDSGRLIEVVLNKYGGAFHRSSTMTWLGEDGYGEWLWSPAGTQLIGPDGKIKWVVPDETIRLIPRNAWWTAVFYVDAAAHDVYCDITSPAKWRSSSEVVLTDLELDLLRHRDGRVDFLDEDEFEAAASATPYPPDVIDAARASWQALGRRLLERDEPFETQFKRWFERIGER